MKKILFLFLILIFQNIAFSQNNVVEQVNIELSSRKEAKILIPKSEIKDINVLAKTISLDYPKGEFWLGYVNEKQYKNFLKLSLKHSLYTESYTKALTMATNLSQMSSWDRYPTYLVYDSLMRRFATTYPEICKLDTIGFSVDNRLILALKISSNPHSDIDKPKFFYTSSMHGDEITGYVLMLRLADWLLSNYGIDQRATNIINNTQVFINPLANPDGTYAYGNNSVSYATRYNANAVDLNRNFPSVPNGGNSDGENWQKETLAFMAYADSNDFSIAANLHGGAEVLNYPFDTYTSNSQSHADVNWFISVSQQFIDSISPLAPVTFFRDVAHSGYTNGGDWYVVDGSRQDYQTYFKHSREITFEVSTDKKLSTNQLNNYWNYLKGGLISYVENCQKGLHGYVRDSLTNEPIRAKIFINSHDAFNSEVYSKASTGYYYRPIQNGTYSITYSADGYYSKTINNVSISSNSMNNQDVILVKDPNDLDDMKESKFLINIYPNPAKDLLRVSLFEESNIFSYSIFNVLGIEIMKGRINDKNSDISIKDLNKGVYLILLGGKTIKFIKE